MRSVSLCNSGRPIFWPNIRLAVLIAVVLIQKSVYLSRFQYNSRRPSSSLADPVYFGICHKKQLYYLKYIQFRMFLGELFSHQRCSGNKPSMEGLALEPPGKNSERRNGHSGSESIPYRIKFRRTKVPKIWIGAENFVRRKKSA